MIRKFGSHLCNFKYIYIQSPPHQQSSEYNCACHTNISCKQCIYGNTSLFVHMIYACMWNSYIINSGVLARKVTASLWDGSTKSTIPCMYCVDYPNELRLGRWRDSNSKVRTLIESNRWLKKLYLLLPSETLGNIRIRQELVGSVWR